MCVPGMCCPERGMIAMAIMAIRAVGTGHPGGKPQDIDAILGRIRGGIAVDAPDAPIVAEHPIRKPLHGTSATPHPLMRVQ